LVKGCNWFTYYCKLTSPQVLEFQKIHRTCATSTCVRHQTWGPAPRCGNLGGQCALPTGQLGLCCLFERRTLADGPVCKTFSFKVHPLQLPPWHDPHPPAKPGEGRPHLHPVFDPRPQRQGRRHHRQGHRHHRQRPGRRHHRQGRSLNAAAHSEPERLQQSRSRCPNGLAGKKPGKFKLRCHLADRGQGAMCSRCHRCDSDSTV
jgi:hypothetical protein